MFEVPNIHHGVGHTPFHQEEYAQHQQEQDVHWYMIGKSVLGNVRLLPAVEM